MTTAEIFLLPVEHRLEAFIERYMELEEFTGCRTVAEKDEMAQIADAILPELIRERRRVIEELLDLKQHIEVLSKTADQG